MNLSTLVLLDQEFLFFPNYIKHYFTFEQRRQNSREIEKKVGLESIEPRSRDYIEKLFSSSGIDAGLCLARNVHEICSSISPFL